MQNFDHALQLDQNLSPAWQGKAAVYINTSQYNLALKAADRAIAVSGSGDKPENAWYLKGYAYNRLEQYDDALLSFDKAIEIDPKRIDFWKNKAYCLTKQGRYMEVLQCYEVMTGIQPDDPELWNKKGEIHMALGQINEANSAFSMAKSLIKNS